MSSLAVVLTALLISHVIAAGGEVLVQGGATRKNFVQRQRTPPDTKHELVFAVNQLNMDVIESELIKRSSPGSSLYQQWLTYDDVGKLVTNPESASAVEAWLNSNKIDITWKSKRLEYIKAEAPISKWENLLSTTFYSWEDQAQPKSAGQKKFVHRAKKYKLPDAVSHHLHAVFNTVQTPPAWRPQYHRRVSSRAERGSAPEGALRGVQNKLPMASGQVTVPLLNQLYGIPNNLGDSSQKQAAFGTGSGRYSPQDLALFQQTFSLPQQAVAEDFGYDTANCTAYDCVEGNLDVQYMMGVAQTTQMVYWYQGGADPFIDWITAVADSSDPPLVNSISWGSAEQELDAATIKAFNTEAMKLALMGVTLVASTGDDGAANSADYCDMESSSSSAYWKGACWSGRGYFPSFPATSPYVTAVGATQGPEDGNPEIACQSQLGGVITTGGGFSTYNPAPAWQVDTVAAYFAALEDDQVPTAGYNPLGRAYPDVSLIGVNYQVALDGEIVSLSGTSASAPVFAAMVSLINAARAREGKPSVGFINPTLWAHSTANAAQNPYQVSGFGVYGDVTSGHNKCPRYDGEDWTNAVCCDSGFHAAEGWDPVTGLGSITFGNLSAILVNPVVVSLSNNTDDGANPEGDDGDGSYSEGSTMSIGDVMLWAFVASITFTLCLLFFIVCIAPHIWAYIKAKWFPKPPRGAAASAKAGAGAGAGANTRASAQGTRAAGEAGGVGASAGTSIGVDDEENVVVGDASQKQRSPALSTLSAAMQRLSGSPAGHYSPAARSETPVTQPKEQGKAKGKGYGKGKGKEDDEVSSPFHDTL